MLIREKDRQALLEIFAAANIPFEVWAYGSRVNGDAHDGSNLNLVIRGQNLERIPSPNIQCAIQ
jgi:predicted nucleotidyltransferase